MSGLFKEEGGSITLSDAVKIKVSKPLETPPGFLPVYRIHLEKNMTFNVDGCNSFSIGE